MGVVATLPELSEWTLIEQMLNKYSKFTSNFTDIYSYNYIIIYSYF